MTSPNGENSNDLKNFNQKHINDQVSPILSNTKSELKLSKFLKQMFVASLPPSKRINILHIRQESQPQDQWFPLPAQWSANIWWAPWRMDRSSSIKVILEVHQPSVNITPWAITLFFGNHWFVNSQQLQGLRGLCDSNSKRLFWKWIGSHFQQDRWVQFLQRNIFTVSQVKNSCQRSCLRTSAHDGTHGCEQGLWLR